MKKIFLLFIILMNVITVNAQWQQVGDNINGQRAQDESGYTTSMNRDGSIIAIGTRRYDGESGTLYQSGNVRVYKNISGTWTQLGQDVNGLAGGDRFGYAVELNPSGRYFVAGSYGNDDNGNNAGQARVFHFDGTDWVQVGDNINGAEGDKFGRSVDISADGMTVIIGADENSDAGLEAGQARVFHFDGTAWVQVGESINGLTAGDNLGFGVSISNDASIIAVSSVDYYGNFQSCGNVRIFENIEGAWVLKGNMIQGAGAYESIGWDIDLSDNGRTIVIGSKDKNITKIYYFNGTDWVQVGNTLAGIDENDDFGATVDISSNGKRVIIGAKAYNNSFGYVRVYDNVDGNWTQVGDDIAGENEWDSFGVSVGISGDGHTIIAGAKGYDLPEGNCGTVRIFEMPVFETIFTVTDGSNPLGDAVISINGEGYSTNENGVSIIYLENNTYDFTVTLSGYYTFASTLTIDNVGQEVIIELLTTGIDEESAITSFSPNPTKGIITIQSHPVAVKNVKVFTTTGEMIQTQNANSHAVKIDLTNQPSGVYFIHIETEKGIAVRKVIKR